MKSYDLSVIGSGMGGSMIASLNRDKNITLFEKDRNLGGCAGTFKKNGNLYNIGATTFAGYESGSIVKDIFDSGDFTPCLKKSDIAIRIIQNSTVIDRGKDFEKFLENIEEVFPNKNNRYFWEKIKEIDEKFWKIKNLYYGRHSLKSNIKTFKTFLELFDTFKFDILKSADHFIRSSLGNISSSYQAFIDSQLLITLQSTSKNLSLLSMALGLSYPFHNVFYVNGGMGSIFDGLLKGIDVKKEEEIKKVLIEKDSFRLISSKDEYITKKLILNSSVYDSSNLFEDANIKRYYSSFSFSDQSAFVITFIIDKKIELLHHYQIILDDKIPNSISNSFFISISSYDDDKMSKSGLSVTISTHTKALYWKNMTKDEYKKQKRLTQDFIIGKFLENFDEVKKEDIIDIFSATSKTFNRYINRYNCGGMSISIKNIMKTPTTTTPFKGLYNVGDSIFSGQGWLGVAIGVNILNEELNG